MEVKLIAYTPNPEELIIAAARQTRSAKGADQLLEEALKRGGKALIARLLELGHLSPIEHASFTFYVGGISRACSHQLVRHRLASYSQQSQRAVKVERGAFVVPPTVASKPEAAEIYGEVLSKAIEAYEKLVSLGVPMEDARYVVPQGVQTKLVVTMNARELLHFFGLRLCERAQWEIRELARRMLEEVKKVAPAIFASAGPRCLYLGRCPEGDDECYKRVKTKAAQE